MHRHHCATLSAATPSAVPSAFRVMDPLAAALLEHRRAAHRGVHLPDGRPRHRPDDRAAPGQHCTVFAAPAELELTAQPWWAVPEDVAAAALPGVRAEVSALLAASGGNPTDRHGMALGFHDGWCEISGRFSVLLG